LRATPLWSFFSTTRRKQMNLAEVEACERVDFGGLDDGDDGRRGI
jgi:hypothetical protein